MGKRIEGMERNMREVIIADRRVADDTGAYVIAELGHNHQGSLQRAEQLIREAAAAGAHAAKLQKRDIRTLFTKTMYSQRYTGRHSFGATYGQHRQALEFAHDEYVHLAGVAAEVGLHLLATAFDLPSVDFLVDLDVPAIKIASGDVTNTPLLRYAAGTGRPLIVSTGGATMQDVRRACETILPINSDLVLLQCTAIYPAAPADVNLAVITSYRAEYPDVLIGFSGHDVGPELSWLACVLGARVIEKHFTLDRRSDGSDHHFSLEPAQLAELCRGLDRTTVALGSPTKSCSAAEAPAVLKMGKKLVAARDLPAGHVLREQDIACKSPGDGMKPYRLGEILGCRLKVALTMDADITLEAVAGSGETAGALAA
jgi:sialic acid synthase